MKTNVYIVKDLVIDKAIFMFTAQTPQELNRLVFGALMSEQKNPFNSCKAEELQILQIGIFDDSTCLLESFTAPFLALQMTRAVSDLEAERVQAIAKETALKQLRDELVTKYKEDDSIRDKVKKDLGIS